MTSTTLLALATFCFATSITPGPNNTLLLASGVNFGFWRSLPHMSGVALGFGAMLLALGLGVGSLFRSHPSLYFALQVLSTVYIVWLAWRIGSSTALSEVKNTARPMTFLQAAGFQWLNPKGWAAGLGAVTAYVLPSTFWTDLPIVATVFAAIMFPCIAVWTAFGVALRRALSRRSALRAFNITMACLLLTSLYPIWVTLF